MHRARHFDAWCLSLAYHLIHMKSELADSIVPSNANCALDRRVRIWCPNKAWRSRLRVEAFSAFIRDREGSNSVRGKMPDSHDQNFALVFLDMAWGGPLG